MSEWGAHRIRRWAPSDFVAMAGLVPIAAAGTHKRAKDAAIALGCSHPFIVPARKMKVPDAPNCSCHDS